MQLSVFERLILMNIMPQATGNIDQLREADKLLQELQFTEKERAALDFKQEGKGIRWKQDEDMPVEIEVRPLAKHVVTRILKQLNEEEKLERAHLPIYERFVEGIKPESSNDGQKDEPIPEEVKA